MFKNKIVPEAIDFYLSSYYFDALIKLSDYYALH